MTRGKWLWILFTLMLTGFLLAEKVATFPEVSRPYDLVVDNERAYVVEGTTIFVYSLADYRLLVKFGKLGEGPREFKVRPSGRVKIYPLDDYIYVNSIGKASVFTKEGKFSKETTAVTGTNFMPLGHQRFVGEGQFSEGKQAYRTIDIFDANLKKMKSVFRQPHINQGTAIRIFFTSMAFQTYKEKIFITGHDDFIIDVFDREGKKLFTIQRDYKKIKISDQIKKNVLAWFKADPRYNERQYQYIKENIQYPEYFSAIDEMKIKDDKIYVRTFNTKGDDYEFIIFDIKGNYLKTQRIHLIRDNPMYPYHYDIANGEVYQVVENLDTETWEFHRTALE